MLSIIVVRVGVIVGEWFITVVAGTKIIILGLILAIGTTTIGPGCTFTATILTTDTITRITTRIITAASGFMVPIHR